MPEQEEELLIYRVMVACGVIGAATLLVGGIAFLALGPRETDAAPGAISSVRAYDASRGVTVGGDRRSFSAGDNPAGVVDFNAIPAAEIVVEWFDDEGTPMATSPPLDCAERRRRLRARRGLDAFPFYTEPRLGLPPGSYTFVVERYRSGRVSEVLARTTIRVGSG